MADDDKDGSSAITEVLERLRESATGDSVTVGDMLATVGRQGFGPLIMLIGLIALTPVVGGIPGASAACGTIVLLLVGQVLLGRRHPWMPRRILRMKVGSDRVRRVTRRVSPYAAKLEVVVRPRLTWLGGPVGRKVADLACVANALLMFPLEFVPYAATLPSAALFALGLGMATQDGLVVAAGLALTVAGLAAPYFLLA